jgi:phage-related protein (TIGR01555 family)
MFEEAMKAAGERLDAWQNAALGVGTSKDHSLQTRVVFRAQLNDATLEALSTEDGLAARLVEIIPSTALRRGWKLEVPGDPSESARTGDAYAVKEDELEALQHFKKGAFWGRLFGGAVTWIGVDDGRSVDLPVDAAAIESVRWLRTYDRRDVQVWSYYQDPKHPKFDQPETYAIRPVRSGLVAAAFGQSVAAAGQIVHESRLIIWGGQMTTEQRKAQLGGWDDSVLERSWDALNETNLDYAAKTQMVGRVSQPVYKIKDYFTFLAGKASENIKLRMRMLDGSRNRSNPVLLDKDGEDFLNIAQPMSGIDSLMDRGTHRTAVTGGLPVSIFMGQSPAGIDATSDAEMELFLGGVDEWSTLEFKPRHEKLTRLVLLSKDFETKGAEPKKWSMKYGPLRMQKPKEKAETGKIQAETFAIWIDKGLTSAEAVAAHIFAPSNTSTEFAFDEKDLKEALERRKLLAAQPPKDNAELGTVGARSSEVRAVIKDVTSGAISRESGKAMLVSLFRLIDEEAEKILGPVDFVAAPTPTKGPAPAIPQGQGAGAPQGMPGFNAGGAPGGGQ